MSERMSGVAEGLSAPKKDVAREQQLEMDPGPLRVEQSDPGICVSTTGAEPARPRLSYSETTIPVAGSRMTLPALGPPLKSNMLFNVPAIASVEPFPIRPRSQLSSMTRKIEDWSVIESSMKFCFAQGETTSRGNRGPKPQRPFWVPPVTSLALGEPQLPGPSN